MKEAIISWCREHLIPTDPAIGVWEKQWLDNEHSLSTKLRIMEHDNGAWIIILSCCSSVAGDEDFWKGVHIGSVRSIAQLDSLFSALNS